MTFQVEAISEIEYIRSKIEDLFELVTNDVLREHSSSHEGLQNLQLLKITVDSLMIRLIESINEIDDEYEDASNSCGNSHCC